MKNVFNRTPFLRGLAVCLFMLFVAGRVGAQNFTWEPIGGPYEGNVVQLTIDSTGHLFAMADDGVYRSLDSGANWSRVGAGPLSTTTTLMAMDSKGNMFLTTANGGLFRSVDQGQTWTRSDSGIPDTYYKAIAVNKVNDELITETQFGIYRSMDHGVTWTLTGAESPDIHSLAIAPDGTAYAELDDSVIVSTDTARAVWTAIPRVGATSLAIMLPARNGDVYIGTEGEGVYRIDKGTSTLNHIWNGVTGSGYITSLAETPNGDFMAGADDGAIYRTTDRGATWTRTNPGDQTVYAKWLLPLPNGVLFASGQKGVYRYDTVGAVPVYRTHGILNSAVQAMLIAPNGTIWVGAGPGLIHSSTDNGASWNTVDLLLPPGAYLNSIALGQNGDLYAGTFGDGVYRTTDNGVHWNAVNNGISRLTVTTFYYAKGTLFAGTDSNIAYRSSDNGNSWQRTDADQIFGWVHAFAVAPNGDLYAGTNNFVYRSVDNGMSWTKKGNGVNAFSLAIDTSGAIYAGSSNSAQIYRSADQGETWKASATNSGGVFVTSIAASNIGYLLAGTLQDHVFFSKNHGTTWTHMASGLPVEYITAVGFDSSGHAYTGVHGVGVYRSVEIVNGVREESSPNPAFAVSLAPVPASTDLLVQLTLQAPDIATLVVSDEVGRVVLASDRMNLPTGHSIVPVHISALAEGTYFVRVTAGGHSQVMPFMVRR